MRLNGRLIDVGWYGDQTGYCIKTIADGDWEMPCYQLYSLEQKTMRRNLQRFIRYETADFPLMIAELFDRIKHIVESERGDEIPVLQELRTTQDAVADYLGIYALRFLNRDEFKWDLASDLLDLVQYRIWNTQQKQTEP